MKKTKRRFLTFQNHPRGRRFALLTATILTCGGVADAALVVTNGDFEADAVAANTEAGTVNITGWFESAATTAYREWIRDDADQGAPTGGAGGAGVAENNNWAAFSGNAGGDLYLHQSVGTLSAGTTTIDISGVSSDRGDRAGTGRHSAIIQVSLWYDDGSAVLADGTALDSTTGLTLIGAMTVGASAGGTFTPQSGSLDIDLTTLNPVGQAKSEAWQMQFGLGSSGVAAGDNIYLQIRYFDSDVVNSRSEAYFDNITIAETVPEPSVALLGTFGLLGLLRRRRS